MQEHMPIYHDERCHDRHRQKKSGRIRPCTTARSSLTYVRFAERRCAGVNMNEVLAYAGIETYQLGDEDHWFTQAQVDLFQEKLAELTGNRDIAREAGRYAASSSSMGIIKYYALSFLNPLKLCEMIGKTAGFFSRSVVWEAKSTGPRTVEITVTPRPGAREKPFQCQGRIGYLEGISGALRAQAPRGRADRMRLPRRPMLPVRPDVVQAPLGGVEEGEELSCPVSPGPVRRPVLRFHSGYFRRFHACDAGRCPCAVGQGLAHGKKRIVLRDREPEVRDGDCSSRRQRYIGTRPG